MNLFDTYENEFKSLIASLKENIPDWQKTKDDQLKKQIESELEIAKDTFDNMKLFVGSTYGGDALALRAKNFGNELATVQEDWARARLSGNGGSSEKWSTGNQLLSRAGRNLDETKKIAAETEEIGGYALGRLRDDGSKLNIALDEMDVIDDNVTRARSVLGNMSRKIIYSKMILIFIICILVLGISVVIFVKWISPLIDYFKPINGTRT